MDQVIDLGLFGHTLATMTADSVDSVGQSGLARPYRLYHSAFLWSQAEVGLPGMDTRQGEQYT